MQSRSWFLESKVKLTLKMLIRENQLEQRISENTSFINLLIYGSNEGLVRQSLKRVKKILKDKVDFDEVSIEGKNIDEDPTVFEQHVNTVSLFSTHKLIQLSGIKEKHLKNISEVFEKKIENIFIIITSDILTKSSKIRTYYEKNDNCLVLACYDDDAKTIIQNTENFIRENKILMDSDVKKYLIQVLSNNRLISNYELEKLRLYSYKKEKPITLTEARSLLNDMSSSGLQEINTSVINGDKIKSSLMIKKIFSEGTSSITLIRGLINYLKRIKKTKIEIRKGKTFDESIQVLKPPVFWKEKNSFKKHCMNIPISSIEKYLFSLVKTEVQCKLESSLAYINCEKSLLLIANDIKKFY